MKSKYDHFMLCLPCCLCVFERYHTIEVNIDEKQQDRLRKTLKSPLSKAKTAAPSQHDEGNANTMRKRGRATAAKAKAKAKGILGFL